MCVKQLAHHGCRVKVEAVGDTEVHSMIPLNPPSLPGAAAEQSRVQVLDATCIHTLWGVSRLPPQPLLEHTEQCGRQGWVFCLESGSPGPPCPLQGQNTEHAVIHFSLPVGASNKKIFMENVPLDPDSQWWWEMGKRAKPWSSRQ